MTKTGWISHSLDHQIYRSITLIILCTPRWSLLILRVPWPAMHISNQWTRLKLVLGRTEISLLSRRLKIKCSGAATQKRMTKTSTSQLVSTLHLWVRRAAFQKL